MAPSMVTKDDLTIQEDLEEKRYAPVLGKIESYQVSEWGYTYSLEA